MLRQGDFPDNTVELSYVTGVRCSTAAATSQRLMPYDRSCGRGDRAPENSSTAVHLKTRRRQQETVFMILDQSNFPQFEYVSRPTVATFT